MEQGIVALLGDTAAAGGNDQAGTLADGFQRLGLPGPEHFFAVISEDFGNGLACQFHDCFVSIHESLAQLLRQRLAHGGLAASGHAHQHDVFHLAAQGGVDFIDQAVIQLGSQEPFRRFLGLGHQHQQTIHRHQTTGFRIQQKLSPGGIVDDIQRAFQLGEQGQIHRGNAGVGIHAHRGGIDDDRRIGVEMEIVVIVLTGAGNGNDPGSEIFQSGDDGLGSAAGAQHQHLLATHIQTAGADHALEAEIVGIMAGEFAVPADDAIDSAQLFGNGGEGIQIGDDILLIGNGHVDAGPIAVAEEIFQFLRFLFKEGKTVIAQPSVDLGGIAVAQFTAQQSAFHQTTSR